MYATDLVQIVSDENVMSVIRSRISSWEAQPPLTFTTKAEAVNYGVEGGLLRDLVHHWKTAYNWTSAVASLNCYVPCADEQRPHFKTTINGCVCGTYAYVHDLYAYERWGVVIVDAYTYAL
ncbi:hypothetical protein SARC_09207 [Sphaeroforma arctica JP610]|uniref:Epoxide hydrolase N-terminal domain-containing protein n=1 Tax=Sphaeroforma arctica JP610 TaxID=667725 RepID=A0A0L0FNG9_9EUKA|nr:hypothetical protein SARC_09207 [Sphaeroforma arctica JP610]KNC78355.1 hypothetical protein SARC_09207 [Sphaeroforma arctica JP610]|eukprot:XP_014152257.1 hypothetical protein SARC_09207 [Sphaeroforma arctica JP610]